MKKKESQESSTVLRVTQKFADLDNDFHKGLVVGLIMNKLAAKSPDGQKRDSA